MRESYLLALESISYLNVTTTLRQFDKTIKGMKNRNVSFLTSGLSFRYTNQKMSRLVMPISVTWFYLSCTVISGLLNCPKYHAHDFYAPSVSFSHQANFLTHESESPNQ